MISGITHISVPVTDQDRALAFYRDALGFQVREDNAQMPGFRWLVVAPQGAATGIVLYKTGPDGGDLVPGGWTGLVLATDDLQGDYKRMKSRGVRFTAEPRTEPWGQEAQFADPDGNLFELVQRG